MILDNLLFHPGLFHLQLLNRGGQDGGGWLHRLGRFRIGFESLVPLDVGEGEMTLGELQMAAGLQLRVIMLLLRLTWHNNRSGHPGLFIGLSS
jgi:hypothetical protein